MTKPHKIQRLYAWIVTDATGEDGIPAVQLAGGIAMPLVGSDKTRIELFRKTAEAASTAGYPVRLVEFSTMTVLEEIPGVGPTPKHI